jgi:hypothetical protein
MRALWPLIERASKRLAHRNLLAIALANKLARIAWAVLARGRTMSQGLHPMPHNIRSLRFTKGMDALSLRGIGQASEDGSCMSLRSLRR